jgi:hypothetical protein
MMYDDEFGKTGGMRIGRGNRSAGENLPQCHFAHQNPTRPDPGSNTDLRVGNQQLTASAIARQII